jgi:dihydrofolate synthase/folylpolyglutamate synthase
VGTALALDHYRQQQVEIAVVEVGVGGANDATNSLEPILSLIGPIGMDHTDTLGSTLAAIAREKAGVMRAGTPVVVSPQEPEARDPIRAAAQATGARLSELGTDFRWQADDGDSGCFALKGRFGTMTDLEMPLRGRCQRDNASMAVAGAGLLADHGWSISEADIRRGLQRVDWPGRFQTVVAEPLTIVDGAHNPAATRALADTIREHLPGRPITLILGMSAEKDAAGSLAELAPVVTQVIATHARHPRSLDPQRLAEAARTFGLDAEVIPDPGEAVLAAWATQPPNGVSLVAGSLFLAGDVLEWLWRASGGCEYNEPRALALDAMPDQRP